MTLKSSIDERLRTILSTFFHQKRVAAWAESVGASGCGWGEVQNLFVANNSEESLVVITSYFLHL